MMFILENDTHNLVEALLQHAFHTVCAQTVYFGE